MEEKKYEGVVQISSAEYRELVTDAVRATERADTLRSENWAHERRIKELETELAETKKSLDACSRQLSVYMANSVSSIDTQKFYNSIKIQED